MSDALTVPAEAECARAIIGVLKGDLLPPPGAGRTRALLKSIEIILADAPRLAREHFLAATRAALRLNDAKPVRRQPSLATQIRRAEKSGREVTSVTLPDGTRLNFGDGEPSEANNPWLDDLKVTKQ